MKNSLFLNEVYSRILRCRFSCAPSIQQLAGLTLLPGQNTASSNCFLKCLGCCNLEHLIRHHEFMVYTCFVLFLFFLVLHVLDLLLLSSFHQKMEVFCPCSLLDWLHILEKTIGLTLHQMIVQQSSCSWTETNKSQTAPLQLFQSCDTEEFFRS